jgi:GT2 family glycosyltransferase
MKPNTAAFIVNYNMPERADALYTHIETFSKSPVDIYLIDNGSNEQPPAANTNYWIENNVQTTAGWVNCLKDTRQKYDYYWFLITSAEFIEPFDPLTPMVKMMQANENIVGVHPALTKDSTSAWTHLFTLGKYPRFVWMIDNIASLYRADWFDSIGGFDTRFIYAWGIDLETAYIARKQNRRLVVCEDVLIRKETDIGYKLDRMGMTSEQRRELARANMEAVFTEKYGHNWKKIIYPEGKIL